jgi:hypothetical protein
MISFNEFMDSQSKKPTKEIIETKEDLVEDKIEEAKTLVENHHIKEDLIVERVEDIGYKIYRDKSEIFSCDMEISGANPISSKARIIIESKDLTYMFEGTIDAQGKCKIPLKKMSFLNENEKGIIKLEVIADDTVFTPWEDNFVAINSKKVSVKVFESREDNTPKIGVRLRSIE